LKLRSANISYVKIYSLYLYIFSAEVLHKLRCHHNWSTAFKMQSVEDQCHTPVQVKNRKIGTCFFPG